MDLNAFLNQSTLFDDAPTDRRKRIERDELAARLKYYETQIPGFETTDEHLAALEAIFTEHRHVCITGGAGVGKTTFVKAVVMRELDYRNMHWSVTATTGIAGSHLDGKTMHSFFGIGLGPDWPPCYTKKMCETIPGGRRLGADVPRPADMSIEELNAWYEEFHERWMTDPKIKPHVRSGVLARLRAHEVLLLDEVSMLPGAAMMGYLDFLLKRVRGNEKPFGGLQMVFIGDFAQLPPVEEDDGGKPDWAFMSRAWDAARVKSIELTKVFRQGDQRFIEFLNHIREGITTSDDRAYARQFVRNDMTLEETRYYTFLVPTNKQAKAINVQALDQYPAPTQALHAEFCVAPGVQKMKDWEINNVEGVKEELLKALSRRLLDKQTFVRVGYPVMFTVNDRDNRFVNGTRGFVREVHILPRVGDNPQDMDHVIVGIPGRTPDDEERRVALYRWSYSRTREQDPYEMAEVPAFWNENPDNPKLPSVISMYPTVRQFPLIPAVSITIHKAQGMSMDSAVLALSRTFAPGHVYVGLSRLRSPKGLVLAEEDFVARVDPTVVEFYRSLRERNER